MNFDQIIILGFTSKNNQIITRLVRKFEVFCELKYDDFSNEELLKLQNLKGIIVSRSYESKDDFNKERLNDIKVPVLDIYYVVDELFITGLNFNYSFSKNLEADIYDFLYKICNIKQKWNMKDYADYQISLIKEMVKDEKVLCALSGGVDSGVTAVLLNRAIGKNLTCMFVDHGLLRKNEVEEVITTFKDNFKINIILIDAKKRFLKKLKGVTEPEKKRKIIGNEFIYVFEEESILLDKFKFLAQGTIYPDILESGTKLQEVVKSHHNVGGLPLKMDFKLVEPLKLLFKDEVRQLGLHLGISEEIIFRQPFPGPGLGVRVLGEITEEKLRMVRESDFILREEIKTAGLHRSIWQYFTLLPNVMSVGMKNDARSYENCIVIRAINTVDAMTASWVKIPYEILDKISKRITSEVVGVNRVLYDITSKPPATIEWE